MMYIDEFEMPVYSIFIVISLIIGGLFNYMYLKKNKIKNKDIKLYVFTIIIMALFFGEMWSFLFAENKEEIRSVYGLSSYGGAIGIVLTSILFEKASNQNKIFIKSATLSLPLIYSISKLACFFAGCCFGLPWDNKFSVVYTSGLNIQLIPIQLIETIVFMILFIICFLLRKNNNIISLTIILSASLKFVLDFFRYDHLNQVITDNQIISLIIMLIGISMMLYESRRIRRKYNFISNKEL